MQLRFCVALKSKIFTIWLFIEKFVKLCVKAGGDKEASPQVELWFQVFILPFLGWKKVRWHGLSLSLQSLQLYPDAKGDCLGLW